jgi:hypothetical protein
MPRIDSGRSYQLAYRQRFSRVCRLFGCAALVAGAMLMSVPWLLPDANASASAMRASLSFGAIAAALGVALLFGRRGKVFDKQEGTLTFWWGVLLPWRQTVYELSDFTMLAICPDRLAEPTRWRIALDTADGARLTIFELARESAARLAVAEIADFLGLPAIVLAPAAPEDGTAATVDAPASPHSPPSPATSGAAPVAKAAPS